VQEPGFQPIPGIPVVPEFRFAAILGDVIGSIRVSNGDRTNFAIGQLCVFLSPEPRSPHLHYRGKRRALTKNFGKMWKFGKYFLGAHRLPRPSIRGVGAPDGFVRRGGMTDA
jgi:hypothetical protein